MIDNLTTAVLVFDEQHRLVTMNPAAEALLAVSVNKVRGLEANALFPDDNGCESALRHISRDKPFAEREMRINLPDARSINVDCVVTPLDHPAQTGGILVELIPLERRQRITREEHLLNQNETARLLVRRFAHEVRNPLGGLRGAAQLLERELADPPLKEYTAIIIREADRLQNLMDRMLGPRTPAQKRPLNVHEVTERVRALLQAEAPLGVSVDRDYDPSIPDLTGDPELLIQAVLNVGRNAVQSVSDHGRVVFRTRVHRQFTIGQRRHRLVVRIDVIDNGPGVPEELREAIFYPMVTGRPNGTGLGLSIAQSLAGQHGGLIECRSTPGATTFSILLPVEDQA